MATITVEMPNSALSALRRDAANMGQELRQAASFHWYSQGLISQGLAAEIAGMTRSEFIDACGQNGVQAIVIDMDELRREAGRGE